MRNVATLAAGIVLCGVSPLSPQAAPPATDVYLVPIERTESGWTPGTPSNLTDRAGYDNQPAFTPDGEHLLYTSYRDGQADVWRVALPDGPAEAVTRTPESEYSPTPLPGSDGELSVVRVEADSTQRLWWVTADGTPVEPLLADVAPVGYHGWLDAERVALYVLGDPPELRVGEPASGDVRTVARRVARSLQPIPGGGLSFVRPGEEEGEPAWLHRLAPDGASSERLVRMPGDGVDHAWGPNGTVWTAVGSGLYAWHPERDVGRGFVRVASLGDAGLVDVSRLAVSPDGRWLAAVAADPTDTNGG